VNRRVGRVQVPLRGDVYKSRGVEEGVADVTSEPAGHCLRELAFWGLALDLAVYLTGEPVDLVDERGSDLIAGQQTGPP
jgi:hypothetical protein